MDENELYCVIATYNFMCGHVHTYEPMDTCVTHTHILVSVNLAKLLRYHLLVGRGIWQPDDHKQPR